MHLKRALSTGAQRPGRQEPEVASRQLLERLGELEQVTCNHFSCRRLLRGYLKQREKGP